MTAAARVLRSSGSVLLWTAVISILVLIASVSGLTDPRVYEQETVNWASQAKGQDLGNLLAVAVLVAAAYRHWRGSTAAGLVWLGTLLYLVYAFVVYAMAVHLNHLFLVYVAVLGLSAWAVLLHVGRLRDEGLRFPRGRTTRVAAVVVALTGVMFAALWLGELVPALLDDRVPQSLVEAGLWVNPIHVLDLSVVLPAFVVTGAGAWRGNRSCLFWLGPWLVFSALMGASIVAAMLLLAGTAGGAALVATIVVTLVAGASVAAAVAYLRSSVPAGARSVALLTA